VKRKFLAGISREELVGNCMLMILGGYETTAGTIQMVAYNLAVHKRCQEKVRQEILETVEKHVSNTAWKLLTVAQLT